MQGFEIYNSSLLQVITQAIEEIKDLPNTIQFDLQPNNTDNEINIAQIWTTENVLLNSCNVVLNYNAFISPYRNIMKHNSIVSFDD